MTENTAETAWDEVDQQILEAVRVAALTHDPMPAGMTERIQWQMTLAGLRAEIAELEDAQPAAVRGATPALTDTLTFRGNTLSLMVTVNRRQAPSEAPGVDLECWVSRPQARVELWCQGVVQLTRTADDEGRLEFSAVPYGSFRFVVHPPDGQPVATPAVEW